MTNTHAAGITTVYSAERPECHAPSGYSVRDYSGKPASTGISPRDRHRATILAFWESQGVAVWRKGGAGGGGAWYVRDMLHDASVWLPLATQGVEGRADYAELSHVRSCENGGAWCACNVVPENGAMNAARGSRDVPADALTPGVRALLAAWPAWWRENVARKASLARLS